MTASEPSQSTDANSHRELEIVIGASTAENLFPVAAYAREADLRAESTFEITWPATYIADAARWMEGGRSDEETVRAFGATLFTALFHGKVGDIYEQSRTGDSRPLRLRLISNEPAIVSIPWELLYDPVRAAFLALEIPLVRGISLQQATFPIDTTPPLRILIVDSYPPGTPPLESTVEAAGIQAALAEVTQAQLGQVNILSQVTMRRLQNELREAANAVPAQPYHVLHFIGHGSRTASGSPVLLFEHESEMVDEVTAERLVELLRPYRLRLVFLNACYSTQASTLDLAQEFAPALLNSGVPAVVGMQVSVSSRLAAQFAQDFYAALADNQPVDQALVDARRAMRSARLGGSAAISIPVCYLRTATGRLADLRRVKRRLWQRLLALTGILVAAVSTIGAFVGLYVDLCGIINCPTPTATSWPSLQGDLKIAVAPFEELTGDQQYITSPRGLELADSLYKTLSTDLAKFEADGFQIGLGTPAMVGEIGGANGQERAERAEQIARDWNADLLLFATLQIQDEQTLLLPELYVAANSFVNAEEVAGYYLLEPIQFEGNILQNPITRQQIRLALLDRANSYILFSLGIGHLAMDHYAEAAAFLVEANKLARQLETTRDRTVQLLFLGTTAALQQDDSGAHFYYQAALELDPDFARAELGAAQVPVVLASRKGCQPDQTDPVRIEEAIHRYQRVLTLNHPPLAEIPTKVALALGNAYTCLGRSTGTRQYWEDAQQNYERVIKNFGPQQNPRIRYLAAEAWGGLGLVYLLGDDPNIDAVSAVAQQHALDAFVNAVTYSRRPNRQALFSLWQGLIQTKRGDCLLAQQAMEAAQAYQKIYAAKNPEYPDTELKAFAAVVETQYQHCAPSSSKGN